VTGVKADWRNITDPIFHYAAERPNAPAFHQGHVTMTYGELAPLVAKAAVHCASFGFRPGARVAICLTNSIDHFILLLGLLRIGVTTMEVNYDPARPISPELLTKFSIRTVFHEPNISAPAGFSAVRIDSGWRSRIEKQTGDQRYEGSGDDIFTISLTSGTTGEAKGSLTSHLQYFQRLNAYTELFADSGLFASENPTNFLLTASISFTTFFRRMVSHLFIGGPVVILPEFMHIIDLVKAIGSWDNALCFVTSPMIRVLLACAPNEGLLFPRLRALVAGGGLLYPEEKLAVLDKVTPNFHESYGASGFGTLSVLPASAMREKAASVGRPPSFVEVGVVNRDGFPVPRGDVGKLRCRGTEGKGFAGDTEPQGDERFRDGWYYPGDLASIDADGYIFLKGRSADIIFRNGVEVFAQEIEEVMAVHPSVREVAVVGVPRNGPGEEMVAIVVAHGQAQHDALAEHCRAKLPSERWPDRVFYAQSLPRTPGGKIDRGQIKQIAITETQRQAGGRPQPAPQ
jgi:acyl-coenzyme A synthetase/AMP-(fatty) acid ligase